jgi:hypothetical protein
LALQDAQKASSAPVIVKPSIYYTDPQPKQVQMTPEIESQVVVFLQVEQLYEPGLRPLVSIWVKQLLQRVIDPKPMTRVVTEPHFLQKA